jgi:redox-sensitive bicupin YhaK (pirin superfamily)
VPDRPGHTPAYDQKAFPAAERNGRLRLIASPDGRDGSLTIHQDAAVYLATLADDGTVTHELRPGRHAWLQVLRGTVTAGGQSLAAGDGLAVSDEPAVAVRATGPAEVMLFDLP